MHSEEPPIELVHLCCHVCQHEVPISEAVVEEATDYVIYFCGLDCFERWRSQAREPGE